MSDGQALLGVAASPGIGIGTAWVWPATMEAGAANPASRGPTPRAGEWTEEWDRFVRAQSEATAELDALKERLSREGHDDEAALFDAHKLLVEDPGFVNPVRERLQSTGGAAEDAVTFVTEQLASTFAAMSDEYFRERASDIRDVGMRLTRLLSGVDAPRPPAEGPLIIVAYDVMPSDTAQLSLETTAALVMEGGGPTSHAAILARARGIPAVVAAAGARELIATGQTVIVDGTKGQLIVAPDRATVARYRAQYEDERQERERWRRPDPEAAVTVDGKRVAVAANISGAAEAVQAFTAGADGIGLFRTEFLYMNRSDPPTEAEQLAEYRRAVTAMSGKPLTFRTLDVGGDKPIPALAIEPEANPFLGWRGIRYCLDRRDIFHTQLRALLQATLGELFVMFPMVSDVSEVRAARSLMAEVQEELHQEGRPTPAAVRIGIMVETPVTALATAAFAPLVDFFSLGTNDLVQYVLGVDRGNPKVAHLYQPYHPGVLRAISVFLDMALGSGKPVGVCGEMAADPLAVPFFVGLGVQELSVAPGHVTRVKRLVRAVDVEVARAVAQEALAAADGPTARTVLDEYRRQLEANAGAKTRTEA